MSSETSNIVLKTENLSIGYRKKKKQQIVASGINIEINSGELVAVIGVNGAGKSTLLKTLSGIIQNIDGQVFISKNKLSETEPDKLAKDISLVLTEQMLSKNLSVIELVALGRQPYTNWIGRLTKNDLKKIMYAIKLVNIEDLKNRKCHELSDGQFQKVLIARALAQDTSLIILDEPTTHLDLYHKAYVLKLLKQLSKETNKAILFASHEINLALQLCDKLLILKENKALFGTPEELIRSNALNDLFPEHLIRFDKGSSSFKIK
ncbi:ABC transporter ATP-binding protein [Christiangramia forsetii]|uniref:ABC-type transporter ATP-binding protein n=2 Tax=Christiangramia forsetii TaxID=411153 RepID=A0M0B1_CHRFK|nr:ABC transporter ATP-binding protein [Christiangramia forsetii]GGG41385.1 ABC transporter ATP-binding protein [Christiangramia forsetii]CAL66056.1 ABC-type transporter ATP-binding protein [Christiangramia forsetii KT0803]